MAAWVENITLMQRFCAPNFWNERFPVCSDWMILHRLPSASLLIFLCPHCFHYIFSSISFSGVFFFSFQKPLQPQDIFHYSEIFHYFKGSWDSNQNMHGLSKEIQAGIVSFQFPHGAWRLQRSMENKSVTDPVKAIATKRLLSLTLVAWWGEIFGVGTLPLLLPTYWFIGLLIPIN